MKITNIHIDVFGGLRDFDVQLSPGVNIIEGANEAGKSSLANFIKFIFFGLSGRGRDNEPSERAQWLSREEGRASGRLELEYGGRLLRVERSALPAARGAVRESFRVADASTGEELSIEPSALCGMPEELFVRTAYVRQTEGRLFDGGDVGEAVNNMLFSADENVNVQKALKKLDEVRCALLHKNKHGGLIFELEREREELSASLAASSEENSELIAKESAAAALAVKAEANRTRLAEVRSLLSRYENGLLRRSAERASALERRRAQLAERENELRRQLSFNGFLPDESYIRSLISAAGELDSASKSEEELKNELELLVCDRDDREEKRRRIEDIRAHGGKAELSARVLGGETRARSLRVFGVIFLLLALLCGAAFLLLRNINALISAGCGFAAFALLFGGVVCFISGSRAKREAGALLEHFGVSGLDELSAALDGAAGDEVRLKYIAEREESLKEKLAVAGSETVGKREALSALLGRWGRTLEGAPGDCVAAVERDAAECSGAIGAAQREREKCEAALESLHAQLGRYSAEELASRIADSMEESELSQLEPAALERERDFLEKAAGAQAERINELERRVAALRVSAKSPAAIADRITVIDARLERLKLRHDACMLACDALGRAGDRLRETIAPRLAAEAGGYMSEITGGRYPGLGVTPSLELSVTGELLLPVELLSSGTRDAAYISLRIALLRLLGGEDAPPAIFDESFARLDDERLSRMLAIISAAADSGLQAIILTSHTRDAQLAPRSLTHIRLKKPAAGHD